MGKVIAIAVFFLAVQTIYCIRKKYFKELIISLFCIAISAFYLVDMVLELNAPNIADILEFVFMPFAKLLFDIKK